MSSGGSDRLALRTAVAGAAVLFGVGVADWVIWRSGPRPEVLELSPQTSYLQQPTSPEGWIDYAGAVDWMRRASLDGGGANAAEPLMRALGPIGRPGTSARAVVERWRSDAGVPPEIAEVEPLRNAGSERSPPAGDRAPAVDEWLRARCQPARHEQVGQAQIFDWLAKSEGALGNLREASGATGLYVPATRAEYITSFERVNWLALADAARLMRCAAAVELLRGDPAASWNDVEAMWKLGLLLARSPDFGEYLMAALFLWKRALGGTVDLAASPATSDETLSAMRKSLGGLGDFPPATEPLLLTRLFMLDGLTARFRIKPPAPRTETGFLTPIGFRSALVETNRHFDAMEAALQLPDPGQRRARLDAAISAGDAELMKGKDFGAKRLLDSEVRARSSLRLASIALALEARRRETGMLPGSLAELGALPRDPGSGESFHYAPNGRRFRLYGVGSDGRDDGGDRAKDEVAVAEEPPRLPPP